MARGLLLVLLLGLAGGAAARLPALRTDHEIIAFTDRVVRLNRLDANTDCLTYAADTKTAGQIVVTAFELHDKVCGGDPATAPRLFTLRYDLRHGTAATDRNSPTGAFRAVRTPR